MNEFNVGEDVIYIPRHAKGLTNHPDAERGVVTSVSSLVFVQFSGGIRGCLPENLQKIDPMILKREAIDKKLREQQ